MSNHILLFILSFLFLIVGPSVRAQQISGPQLERKIAYPDSTVYVPYSNLCLIEKAGLPSDYGWVLEEKILENNEKSVLLIEMNSEIFSIYSSGSVQLLIELPAFKKTSSFDVRSENVRYRLINNYGGVEARTLPPNGSFVLSKVNGNLKISGSVLLATSAPATRQVITFSEDLIPDYTLSQFQAQALKTNFKKERGIDELVDALVESMMKTHETHEAVEEELESIQPPGEGFRLSYSNYGLGSNQFYPSRITIFVHDSILSYGIMEESEKVRYIDFATGDTTFSDERVWYDVPFSETARDSILTLLNHLQGKYVYQTDPYIMSGSIDQIYLEYNGRCTEFCIKNAYNKTAYSLYGILNPYLPADYRFHIGFSAIRHEKNQLEPSISECTGRREKSYVSISGEEYESLRATGKQR